MNGSPRVSFILPIFNAASFLAETLESLFTQTFENFEIIAINDGSTDGTSEVLRGIRDFRLRVIERENRGLSRTLNEAIGLARGEYLARVDADDICLPHRLAAQVEFFESHPSVAVLGSAIEIFSSDRGVASRVMAYPTDPAPALLFRNALAHPSVTMRNETLRDHGLSYQSAYPRAEDYFLWCNCVAKNIRMANLPDVLIRYRAHAGQITHVFADATPIESDAIRNQFLQALGLAPTQRQSAIHNAIASDCFVASADFINDAAAWLADLASRPAILSRFDRTPLLSTLTGRYVALALFARSHQIPMRLDASAPFVDYIHPHALD